VISHVHSRPRKIVAVRARRDTRRPAAQPITWETVTLRVRRTRALLAQRSRSFALCGKTVGGREAGIRFTVME
jgi:hypothetical protein